MAAPLARNVIRAPGKLVKNPTNLALAYPYGGTELGETRDTEFRFGIKTEVLVAEEWQTPISVLTAGELAIMAGVFRSWDDDLLALLFPNVETGASTGKKVVAGLANSGNRTAGYDMKAQATKILFSPLDLANVPMILMYNPIPLLDVSAKLALVIGEEFGVSFAFDAAPDQRGWSYRIGNKDDLASKL